MGETEISHDEAAGQFNDHLVHGVFCRAETSGEVAVETMLCAPGVTSLMTEAAVVAGGINEALERRHEHRVDVGAIASFIAARDDRNVQCSEKGIHSYDALGVRKAWKLGRSIALDLACIEDIIAASEESRPIFALVAVRAVGLIRPWVVAITSTHLLPEHDRCCLLSLADLAAEL